MVAEKDDQRGLPELQAIEGVEQSAYLGIHKGHSREIRPEEINPVVVGEGGEIVDPLGRDRERRSFADSLGRAVEPQSLLGIEIKILPWSMEGIMRAVKSCRNDPGAAGRSQLFDRFDRGSRGATIGLFVIAAIKHPNLTPAEGAAGEVTEFASPVRRLRRQDFSVVPRLSLIQPDRSHAFSSVGDMEDLSVRPRSPAVLAEQLRKGDGVWERVAEELLVVDDPGRFAPLPNQQRRAAGIADGVLRAGMREADTTCRQAVEVRGLRHR